MAPTIKIVNTNRNVSHWNLENGYDSGNSEVGYPIRASNPTGFFDIGLVTNIEHRQVECRGAVQGFRLNLNVPGEAVELPSYGLQAHFSEMCRIWMRPKFTTTSEGLRKYNPDHRGCFFNDERRLRFFKTYTKNSCDLECLANFTVMHCGCVHFSMPSESKSFVSITFLHYPCCINTLQVSSHLRKQNNESLRLFKYQVLQRSEMDIRGWRSEIPIRKIISSELQLLAWMHVNWIRSAYWASSNRSKDGNWVEYYIFYFFVFFAVRLN